MLNVKPSLFVESATDFAVIAGDAFAMDGGTVGGVYVADVLGEPTGIRVPQPGEQAAFPAVNTQLTPLFEKSFVIDTFTVTAPPPVFADWNLLVIVTETAGVTILNVKLSFLVLSVTDAAVIVGDASAAAGGVAGG
jgi:hypothetical protein